MCSRASVVGAVLGTLLGLGVGTAGFAHASLVGGPVLSEATTPTGVQVSVDIRPGSERNPVNPKSEGVLPVAILSSETFDATQADPSTVFLEEAPVASPSEHGKFLTSEEDVNGDGLTDLLVKIETDLLELVTPTGMATLVGSTFEGDAFWGEDYFTVVPPDVANDSWALQAVAACIGSEIVLGYPDGLYHPEVQVSRDQMAVFIARAAVGGDSAVPKSKGGPEFSDVGRGNWAYDYIQYASDAGIVQGYSDGSYRPACTVTRGEMAAFMARSVASPQGEEGLAGYQPPATASFSDVPRDSWCYKYVEYLAEHGVVSGYADATYRPADSVTRDQMAVYIARAFRLVM